MKKKRFLRKSIETTMATIMSLIMLFLVMLDDFTINSRTILILLGMITIVIFNFYILTNYGRRFKKVHSARRQLSDTGRGNQNRQ